MQARHSHLPLSLAPLLGLLVIGPATASDPPAAPRGGGASLSALITSVAAPTAYVDPPDGLAHRFVARQAGQILVWDGTIGTNVLATPFLDLRNDASVPAAQRKVLAGGEQGLLSMVVHPQYRVNGYFYLYYTSRDWDGAGGIGAGDIVVERYTRDPANPNRALPASAQIVLVVGHGLEDNHNGGDLEFGPDGLLYVSLGDGGSGCDDSAHSGQDTSQLLGKLLRLDVDGADAFPADPLRNYAIPPSNPLVGFTGRGEIWALGLRNPFRFSFDRQTGDLLLGDVGQDDWEEINRLPAGPATPGSPVNFGWPCREGFDPSECPTPPQGCGATFTNPVRVEANAGEGGTFTAIMGGYLYRGTRVPGLAGLYLYGDAGNEELWRATPGTPPWPASLFASAVGPYGFAEDNFGELYVLSAGTDSVSCFHDGAGCDGWALLADALFADGFESGDISAWSFSQ